ncbi:MAG: hypothetical protein QOC83_5118, partial [Pseudonocardiales bacterium]|nr:hypothetical protein [Pseudonocardiales bacterium]
HRDTRRTLRHELDRMALVTLATSRGRVAQRSQTPRPARHPRTSRTVPLSCRSVHLDTRDSFKSYSHYEKLI